jgi:hypothetical protein
LVDASGLADHVFGPLLAIRVPPEWTAADVLNPETKFGKLPETATTGTLVLVAPDSMTWFMLGALIVCEHWREGYRIAELITRELPEVSAGPSYSAFGVTAEFRGHVDKWVLLRSSDGHVLRRGLANRDAAVAELLASWAPNEGRTTIAR